MNKSEELAKLLGIEPHIQTDYCYWECKNPKKQFRACRKKTCNHFKKGCITYPDFTKPSNFVKLQNLIIANDINIFWFKSQLNDSNEICCEFQDFILYDEKYNLIDDDFEQCMERSAEIQEEALINTLYYCLGGEITDDNMYNSWIPLGCCINYSDEINKVCDKFDNIKKQAQQTEWE